MEKIPKIELPKKSEEPEVETWENEGGSFETKETPVEVPETVIEENQAQTSWREILMEAKKEFPENIKKIIDKAVQKEQLTPQEIGAIDSFSYRWFREQFGLKVKKRKPPTLLTPEELARREKQRKEQQRNKKIKKKLLKLQKLSEQKARIMERLHLALRNLDIGESVGEFMDETRRVVYFDEETQRYFVEENGTKRSLGVGDIVSDYAWGIKYFPDSMIKDPTVYRNLAKKILVNEARRNLEMIRNNELVTVNPEWGSLTFSFTNILKKLRQEMQQKEAEQTKEKTINQFAGFAAEVIVREYLSRIISSLGLDFFVLRANAQEDAEFKYDFKIRLKRHIRGIDVEPKNIKSIGFQLKTQSGWRKVQTKGYPKGKKVGVDDVIQLNVPGGEIRDIIKKWFEAGEPSGGPEQFLSSELKKAILKAVTAKLADIPQEVFEKI